MGRHREFNEEEALDAAQEVFWSKGYERASLSQLTKAMGINGPSLYLAFGSKEELFHRVIDRYERDYLGFTRESLKQPTAGAVVETLLHGLADAHSNPEHPPGCLGVTNALPYTGDDDPIRGELARRRVHHTAVLRERFERAQHDGDLPRDADADTLARYIMTVAWGMAVEAMSGATRAQLHAIATQALSGFPVSTPSSNAVG